MWAVVCRRMAGGKPQSGKSMVATYMWLVLIAVLLLTFSARSIPRSATRKPAAPQHSERPRGEIATTGPPVTDPPTTVYRHALPTRKSRNGARHPTPHPRTVAPTPMTTTEYASSEASYDALLAGPKGRAPATAAPLPDDHLRCDPFAVPFVHVTGCEALLRNMSNWLTIEPMAPKYEQRTIKFRVTVRNTLPTTRRVASGGLTTPLGRLPARVQAILKVPQMLFPTEPFSEVAAYSVERVLGVNRIPPTVLVAVPLATLMAVVDSKGGKVGMVSEHNDRKLSWAQWVHKETVWCSVQLVIAEVTPLLSSKLKLPYSKAKPGWHRWFNPRWEGFAKLRSKGPAVRGALLAVSELAMVDFLLLNNDRSPNKNNFVVHGCVEGDCSPWSDKDNAKRGSDRVDTRASLQLGATFVHLDQGMALNGFPHPHNPIAKPANNTFCWFYRPLYERVRALVELHHSDEGKLGAVMAAAVPRPVIDALGRRHVEQLGRQLTRLVAKVAKCIEDYKDEALVLVDARSTGKAWTGVASIEHS
jgi:hypothetical protein